MRRRGGVTVSVVGVCLVALGAGLVSAPAGAVGGPVPIISAPAANATLCTGSRVLLTGSDKRGAGQTAHDHATWAFSTSSGTVSIPSARPAADSWSVRPFATLANPSTAPVGPADVRLTLTSGLVSASVSTPVHIDASPVIGPVGSQLISSGPSGAQLMLGAQQAHDQDGGIVAYAWNFGDGTVGTGQFVTHTFTRSRSVALTITDNAGCRTTSAFNVTVPQSVSFTFLIPSLYCDPLSMTVNNHVSGTTSNGWPQSAGNGIPTTGKQPTGNVHNDVLATGYSFEVVAKVLGIPALCKHRQLIKTTRTVAFKDGTTRTWTNPATGGADGDFHSDDYGNADGPWDYQTYGNDQISWYDIPRVYNDENFGGTYNATTNPVVKAKVVSEVLDEVDGNEAPIVHAEGEGPGETVFKQFKVCAYWAATIPSGTVVASLTPIASGGPDAAAQNPKQDNTGPSGWGASAKAITDCS